MNKPQYIFSQLVAFMDSDKFCKHKGRIKIYAIYDLETLISAFFHISTAPVHDSKTMKEIPMETGAYYIFERGYNVSIR